MGREEGIKEGREWKEAEGEGGVRMQKRGKRGRMMEVSIGRFNEGNERKKGGEGEEMGVVGGRG